MKLKIFVAGGKEQRERGALHTDCGEARGAALAELSRTDTLQGIGGRAHPGGQTDALET